MRLKEKEYSLLIHVAEKRDPTLLPIIRTVGITPLSDNKREALQDLLLDEMLECGLADKSEANQYGIELDDLIGRLLSF